MSAPKTLKLPLQSWLRAWRKTIENEIDRRRTFSRR